MTKKYHYKATGKNGGVYYIAQDSPANNDMFTQITRAEYEAAMEKNERAEKERQFKRLMVELYPPEED